MFELNRGGNNSSITDLCKVSYIRPGETQAIFSVSLEALTCIYESIVLFVSVCR